jgi:hypothetical protein
VDWRFRVLDKLALKFEVLLPELNERQRRLLLAAGALCSSWRGELAHASASSYAKTGI